MNEREDIEVLAELIHAQVLERDGNPDWEAALFARRILASSWLAAHVEAVRVSERVRLAGELQSVADEYLQWVPISALRAIAENQAAGVRCEYDTASCGRCGWLDCECVISPAVPGG